MASTTRSGLLAIAAASITLGAASATAMATGASGPSGTSGTTGSTGATATTGTTGATPKPSIVACPASVASSPIGAVQWLWSAYGKPNKSDATVSYTQTVGSGSWSNGSAKGTICSQDQGGGAPKRSIVLKVTGSSKLSPDTTQLGLVGIGLVLHVSVSASGDKAVCPVGSTGTVSLFASYYSVHEDHASMRFAGTCAAWDQTLSGSILHVKISHNGAMIR